MASLTLSTQLKRWARLLEPCSDSARLDAEILLKHATGLSDAQLITRDNQPLDDDSIAQVNQLVESRQQGTPIAYLTGWREFYALNLQINPHVLIPRPETELLVDTALKLLESITTPGILDLGTGSGAIALAITANTQNVAITATDIDEQALKLAEINAHYHQIKRINFLHSNWYACLEGQYFDLIVSNPPYIDPEDPHLQQGDVRFEPRHALVADNSGKADIRRIAKYAPDHLNSGGWIVLEHGYDQGEFTRELLASMPFVKIQTLQDLNQHDRITLACYQP